jgi:deoxycytidine triphosphate deaminase
MDPTRKQIPFRFPPTGLPWQKSIVNLIEDQKYHWQVSKDPLAPWAAIRLCRRDDIDLPRWVEQYLGDIAERIFALVEDPKQSDIPAEINRVLGFRYGAPLTRWKYLNKLHRVFLMYQTLRFANTPIGASFEQIAKEIGSTPKSIRSWLTELAHTYSTTSVTVSPDDLVQLQKSFDLDLEPHSMIADSKYLAKVPPRKVEGSGFGWEISTETIDEALDSNELIVTPHPTPELIGRKSIWLTLDDVGIASNTGSTSDRVSLNPYRLSPKTFIIAPTRECIKITGCQVKGYIHPNDGLRKLGIVFWSPANIDPGFAGRLLLQIYNESESSVDLHAGGRVCELEIVRQCFI